MPGKLPALLLLFGVLLAPAQTSTPASTPAESSQHCPVTAKPETTFVPPPPFPARPAQNAFYFGDETLWVMLSIDWRGMGRKTENGYRIKIPWFSRELGQDELKTGSHLSVTGVRLDGVAPPLLVGGPHPSVTQPSELRFYASTLTFPTGGCWAVSARRHNTRLQFVLYLQESL